MKGKGGNRYLRNQSAFTQEEDQRIRTLRACVVGCGGLGGYLIEMLARLGVEAITAVDGDAFDETNLNRQLLAQEELVGQAKVLAAEERVRRINRNVRVLPRAVFLDGSNSRELIRGHHLVFDGLDGMEPRRLLAEACREEKITLIHGAVAGWNGQAAVIRPGDRWMDVLYPSAEEKGEEAEEGAPSFAPAIVAAIQVVEGMKVFLGKGDALNGQLLTVDLLHHRYEILTL